MNLDRFNWNDLRYFLEVARRGRLLLAADRLGVAHTTVARRIAALEDTMQAKLFVQENAGYQLTALGEQMLPLAEQMESAAELLRERMNASGQSLAGRLRVGAPDGFGNAFLAGALVDFCAANPDLTIELVPIPLRPNLSKREVDIAVMLDPSQQPGTYCRKITDYRLFLFTSRAYLDRHGIDPSDRDQVFDSPFAGYIDEILYTQSLAFNKSLGHEVQGNFQGATVLAQYEHVANGGGFGVLPNFMARQDPRLVPVFPDEISFTRSYWLLIPEELRRLASVRGLARAILDAARRDAAAFMPA